MQINQGVSWNGLRWLTLMDMQQELVKIIKDTNPHFPNWSNPLLFTPLWLALYDSWRPWFSSFSLAQSCNVKLLLMHFCLWQSIAGSLLQLHWLLTLHQMLIFDLWNSTVMETFNLVLGWYKTSPLRNQGPCIPFIALWQNGFLYFKSFNLRLSLGEREQV